MVSIAPDHDQPKSARAMFFLFNIVFLFYLYIFILFRFFDIKKPFPVSFFDRRFKNSFGVIMDDVIAGFYVVLTLVTVSYTHLTLPTSDLV